MRFSALCRILLAATFVGPAVAQTASYTHIPQPDPHGNPFPPWFTALNTPRIGTTFQVSAPSLGYGCPCHPTHFLMTGFSNPAFDTTVLGTNFSGVLMTSPQFVADRFTAHGSMWIVDFPVPNDVEILGLEFFQQVAMLYQSPTFGPSVLFGRGGHGVIGN